MVRWGINISRKTCREVDDQLEPFLLLGSYVKNWTTWNFIRNCLNAKCGIVWNQDLAWVAVSNHFMFHDNGSSCHQLKNNHPIFHPLSKKMDHPKNQ